MTLGKRLHQRHPFGERHRDFSLTQGVKKVNKHRYNGLRKK